MSSNLTSPAAVRDLLNRYDVRPSKRWGQNFLIDRNALERVVAAAELSNSDCVLEIGPGLGALTRALSANCASVLAVEVDPRLVSALGETVAGLQNVQVVEADFLALDLDQALSPLEEQARRSGGAVKVAANIPYSITSPVIVRLLENGRFERIVLMVQTEVANRLTARPSTSEYGSLTLFVRLFAEVEVVGTVSRRCFFPAPDVDSTILRLRILASPRVDDVPPERLLAVVHASFQQRRKSLINSLSGSRELGWSREQAARALASANIDPSRRGETLDLEEFARLARVDMP